MSRLWQADSEPIPGYRLTKPLGKGGFGEVWEAIAPGGIRKAIKFVSATAFSPNMVGNADRELEGLAQMREIRHPFVLSIERYEIVDDQLIIVTELADRNLDDRWRECRSQGLAGIPRSELLGYLAEAAEALDLMNTEYGVQHLDVKPSNLFLVRSHIKVADFGLAKALEGFTTKVATGMTPIYAAPETFDGWASRVSDQYSLAIVYQELLTGRRPFPGPSARQFMMQHLTSEPDLTSLPADDQNFVAIALSKTPKDRYPTCSQFIADLRSLTGPETMPFDSSTPEPISAAEMTSLVAKSVAMATMTQSRSLLETTKLAAEAPEPPEWTASSWICPIPIQDRRWIANFKDIGPFPDWATELAELMLVAPEPTVPIVAELVAKRPKLAEKLVAIANHPSAKRPYKAPNVPRAVSVLGTPQTCSLLIASALVETKLWQVSFLPAPWRAWWQERVAWTACIAYTLASTTNSLCPHRAFLLSLLQDLGIAAMLQAYPKRYRLYTVRSRNMPRDNLAANEKQWFGFTHADASASILELWGFSPPWLSWIGRHHNVAAAPDYPQLLAVAERWADFLDGKHDERIPELVRSLKPWKRTLTQATSIDLPAAHSKAKEIQAILNIPVPSDKAIERIAYSLNAFK